MAQNLHLCIPDALGVLVQIFLLDVKEQDRSQADGQMWKEDSQWARILDEGWDLGRVKQVCPLHPFQQNGTRLHANMSLSPSQPSW